MSRVNSAGLGWTSSLIAVCVLIGGSTEVPGADQPADKIKEVRAAWQERQKAVHSATIRWIERHTLTEEVQSEDPEGKSPPAVPPDPFETIGKLSFDGIKMRYSGTFRILNSAVGKFEIKRFTSTFDGVNSRDLWDKSPLQDAQGIIHQEASLSSLNQLSLKPAMLIYKPLNAEAVGFTLESMKAEPVSEVIKKVDCLVLIGEPYARGWRQKLWLDPAHAYLPIRHAKLNPSGLVQHQMDWSYEVNQQGQRIPKVCTRTDFSADGVVQRTLEFRFKDVSLNDVHPAAEFDLKFPAGAWVTDWKKNPRGKARQVQKDESP